MAGEKQTPKRKKEPNKQKEMAAASLLRMAEDAREQAKKLREQAKEFGGAHEAYAIAPALERFADIHETEAKTLRKMR